MAIMPEHRVAIDALGEARDAIGALLMADFQLSGLRADRGDLEDMEALDLFLTELIGHLEKLAASAEVTQDKCQYAAVKARVARRAARDRNE